MTPDNWISFKCMEVNQPIGTFYIGAIDSFDLVSIAYSDVRRIEKRDVEKYLGIERELSPERVKELKEYVNNVDATFPSSIIIAVNSENAKYDEKNKLISIKNETNVAKIIDGQHRIAGLENHKGDTFQLIVTLFIDMELEDQAMVFATINLKQTKVSKSLAYDLYEYTKNRSPQKSCHNIVKMLNSTEESPFKNKIKILGKATGEPQESITQATFVERLIKYISKNANADRDLLKRGKKIEEAKGKEREELIFRNLFRADKDAYIAKNLWNYFAAVDKRWSNAWQQVKKGNILNRTTGFGALMRFLRDIYISYKKYDEILLVKEYLSILDPISMKDPDFTPENFKPGSSGEKDLYERLKSLSGLPE